MGTHYVTLQHSLPCSPSRQLQTRRLDDSPCQCDSKEHGYITTTSPCLSFSYDDGILDLFCSSAARILAITRRSVAGVLAPSAAVPLLRPSSGFWFCEVSHG